MIYVLKVAPIDYNFIDKQAASQWQYVEENGMYRDPHEPMLYDFVTRGLFAMLFHFGYRGKYYERWDNALKRAGLCTLKMLSVTGELPYGGRSNQFMHNEAQCATIAEYEANRYFKLGDIQTASRFKTAVKNALDNIELWLEQKPITHVKNAFPCSSSYGCEEYAYFDKYMITAASGLYVAYLFSDDDIPLDTTDNFTTDSFLTSDYFHKLFLRAGEYFFEYDYRADYNYDASGLGRLHRKGAPSQIAISTPGTNKPTYTINANDATPFAIAPEIMYNGQWLFGSEQDAIHKIEYYKTDNDNASAQISCTWQDKTKVKSNYLLDKNGLQVTVTGNGKTGLMLPAFAFDGKNKTQIENNGIKLNIQYQNWQCTYNLQAGVIRNTGKKGYNRNGYYDLYRAENDKEVSVRISITPR